MNGRDLALASLGALAVAGAAVQRRREGSFVRQGSRRPAVDPVTRSPAFQAWFKQSVVTDTRGQPLVVYHGTPDARGLLQEGFRTHADRACWRRDDEGDVFFASASPKVAESYADESRAWDFQGSEPAVVPLYLSIQDPLVVDARGHRWRNTQHQIDRARAAGHDGIIIQDSVDYYDSPPPGTRVPTTTVYAWFSPTQAKSAMKAPLRSMVDGKLLAGSGPNAGTWDPANPVLSANRGSPTHSTAFNRWFSGSRVTHDGTASGEPLRVYHGTRVHFDTFRTRRGPDRLGAYFTVSPDAAGKMHGGVPIVMPVYLRIYKPMDVRHVAREDLAAHLGLSEKARWETQTQGSAGPYSTLEYLGRKHDLVPKLKRRGYDGIVFDGQHEGDTYVVFDPRQVKSAIGNRGTYHAHDARISANRTGSANVGTFLDADLPGYLVGWRVMQYDPEQGDAVSNADSRQRVPLAKGAATRLRGIGMFLGSTAAYVRDYYGGNDHNVLMRYAFRREDVTRGNLTDREPEIAVREAILLDWTIFDGEET